MCVANEEYVIGPLGEQHNQAAFRCADHHITNYFRRHALVNMQSRIATVWVLHDPNADRVIGFYALSTASVDFDAVPPEFTARLPRYPLSVVRLGRMGVDRRYEGQGFGRWLVVNALMRIYRQNVIAAYALIVDPKEGVRDFYLNKFGFIPLVNNPNRLFLHLQTFVDTLAAPPSP